MANAVVHFEIIGRDPAALRRFYAALFGWNADTDSPVAATRTLGPAANPNGTLVIGQFTDPEGNLLGVAGPAPSSPDA